MGVGLGFGLSQLGQWFSGSGFINRPFHFCRIPVVLGLWESSLLCNSFLEFEGFLGWGSKVLASVGDIGLGV